MARDSQAALVALNRFGFGARGGASGDLINAASDPRGFVKSELARPNAVLLEAPGIDEPAALIKRVKQALREVPNKGAGFGVLRHVEGGVDDATRAALTALPASPVLFTYLGTLDAMAAGSALFTGAIEPWGFDGALNPRREAQRRAQRTLWFEPLPLPPGGGALPF